MKLGTKSVLFGAHCFFLHPFFVAWAWWKLYGFPWDVKLWFAFFLHDIGYIGKPNMDGPEGEQHPALGATIMHWLFDEPEWGCDCCSSLAIVQTWYWHDFCKYHSRYLAKKDGVPYSRLCVADKLSAALTPWWVYIPMTTLTGEIFEYMKNSGRWWTSRREWFTWLQAKMTNWAWAHKNLEPDTEARVRYPDAKQTA